MKIKILSFFLAVVLLTPSIYESLLHLDHYHETCNKDGIHFHENLPECDLCQLTKFSNKDFLYSNNIFSVYIINNDYYHINSFYHLDNYFFNPSSRGPPIHIS